MKVTVTFKDVTEFRTREKRQDYRAIENIAMQSVTLENIQHMDATQLVKVQNILRHGDTLGEWVTPEEWLVAAQKGRLKVDMKQRIIDYLPNPLQELLMHASAQPNESALVRALNEAVLIVSRYLVLLRLVPSSASRRGSLAPSSVAAIAYKIGPQMVAKALAHELQSIENDVKTSLLATNTTAHVGLLNKLLHADLQSMTENARQECLVECHRMETLRQKEYWSDVPSPEGLSLEQAITGQAVANSTPNAKEAHIPLPDDYVSLMGQRSLWLMHDLAPNIFLILTAVRELWDVSARKGLATSTLITYRNKGLRQILSKHHWRNRNGVSFDAPPFALNLSNQVRSGFGSKNIKNLSVNKG